LVKIKITKLDSLIKQRDKLTEEILDIIARRPNYGGECHCGFSSSPNIFMDIHEGNLFNEIVAYCIECGGIKV